MYVSSNDGTEWSSGILQGVRVIYGSVLVVFLASVTVDFPFLVLVSWSSVKMVDCFFDLLSSCFLVYACLGHSSALGRAKIYRPSLLGGGDWTVVVEVQVVCGLRVLTGDSSRSYITS